jgi:hypothetical protein
MQGPTQMDWTQMDWGIASRIALVDLMQMDQLSLYNLISTELIFGDIKKLTGQTIYFS